MAYTVNKSNNSASPNQYTVQDGVVNTQTDLSLIGKGYAGYGELIGENFLHLLENFASDTAPTNAKRREGQLWFDTSASNKELKYFDGVDWRSIGGGSFVSNMDFIDNSNYSFKQEFGASNFWCIDRGNFMHYDTPNTTSAIIYKVQFKNTGATGVVRVASSNTSGNSPRISVQEIAQ